MPLGHPIDRNRSPDLLLEQQITEAQPEDEDPDAADALLGLQVERHHAVQEAHDEADADADEDTEERVVRLQRCVIRTERTEQHDALDAEVEHTRPLAEGLAEACQQEGRCQPNRRRDRRHEHGNSEELAHCGASSPGKASFSDASNSPAASSLSRRS